MVGGLWGQSDSAKWRAPFAKNEDWFLLASKFMWRMGFVQCPEACAADTSTEACACACPLSVRARYGDNSTALLEATGVLGLFGGDADAFSANGISDDDLVDELCHVGLAGELFTSAAPQDPLFWPLHGNAERFVQSRRDVLASPFSGRRRLFASPLRRRRDSPRRTSRVPAAAPPGPASTEYPLSCGVATTRLHGISATSLPRRRRDPSPRRYVRLLAGEGALTLDETWGYEHVARVASDTRTVCDWSALNGGMPTCVKSTCPGHRADDLLPFMDLYAGQDRAFSNEEFYQRIGPDSDLLPYVYNSLSRWPGCAGGELVVSDGGADDDHYAR